MASPAAGRPAVPDRRSRADRTSPLGNIRLRRRPTGATAISTARCGLDLNYGAAEGPAANGDSARSLRGFLRQRLAQRHRRCRARRQISLRQRREGRLCRRPSSRASFCRRRIATLVAPTSRLLLPLWAQKDFGGTSLFGGGGYEINPGSGNKDFWQAGRGADPRFQRSPVAWHRSDLAIRGHARR